MQTEHRLLFELVPEVTRAIDMRVYRGKRADREFQARTAADESPDQRRPCGREVRERTRP